MVSTHKRNITNKTNRNLDPELYFSALKLIEQLYRDGEIPEFMFLNILNEYAEVVDASQFLCHYPVQKGVIAA